MPFIDFFKKLRTILSQIPSDDPNHLLERSQMNDTVELRTRASFKAIIHYLVLSAYRSHGKNGIDSLVVGQFGEVNKEFNHYMNLSLDKGGCRITRSRK